MGLLYPSSEGFLMIRILNVCVEKNSNGIIPIFGRGYTGKR